MMIDYRICRVVSSIHEAKNFIVFFKMRIKKEFPLFPIYCDKLKHNWLVISGCGKKSISSSIVYLHNCSQSKSNAIWINYGVGFKKEKVSNIYFIDEIIEQEYKDKVYPSTIDTGLFKRSSICTVKNYRYNLSIFQDMDCYQFFKTASKIASYEFIIIIKISVNKEKLNNKEVVQKLVKKHFDDILKFENTFKKLSKLISLNLKYPKSYFELNSLFHFTTYQKHQLKTLLKKWYNINSQNIMEKISDKRNADYVIKFLRKETEKGIIH